MARAADYLPGTSPASTPLDGWADDELPLRSELFSVRQLEELAKSLAGSHVVEDKPSTSPDRLLPRLADNKVVLQKTYELITDALTRGRRITPAAEWFLDNYHLIEEQIRAARRHLPRKYSRELPRLVDHTLAGYPRVYDIALELISHADGRVDMESLRAFIVSYQSIKPLRLGELWAIPIMLRLALLENLRRVAVRIAHGRHEREHAAYWIERLQSVATNDPTKVVLTLAEMVKADPPLTNAFVAEFASRLHGQGPALIFPMTWLEQRLAEQGQAIDRVFQQASQNQAADQVSIGNSIGSLRFLGATEWQKFVESTSVVEQVLLTDPAGVYSTLDFATRDRYRHALEQVARQSPLSEREVAQFAVNLARRNETSAGSSPAKNSFRRTHVGYFLIDDGLPILEREARMRRTVRQVVRRALSRIPLLSYLSAILLLTAVVTWMVVLHEMKLGASAWSVVIAGTLAAVSVSQLAIAIVQWATTVLVGPRVLPRLDFLHGIPDEHRTIVAVPTMLTDLHEIDDLLNALEIRYLANSDNNLSFALLTDFCDAPQGKMPEDDALLTHVVNGIKSLNAKYAGPAETADSEEEIDRPWRGPAGEHRGRFLLLHRNRRWNEQEGNWMGWERKRGKLEELNAALRGNSKAFASIVGDRENLERICYVITLDSDTQLPRDSARQLIGTMAHPLNRPYFDEKLGRVTEGYSILQPRVGISMPSANRSRFARLFAGEPGIDPYTRAVSDVYQDVFAEGSFIGKGIYDVDAMQQSLGERLPENRILSHDLLEGAHGRSGLVSDVTLFEDYPSAYPADVSRRYRWIRGDWQIAQWMLSRVPGAGGKPVANSVSLLSRWKIFDNLRRSVMPIAILALLLFGWMQPGQSLFITLLVVTVYVAPGMLIALADLSRRPSDLPIGEHCRSVGRTLLRQLLRDLFTIACLPYDAYFGVDAITRTADRVCRTGRRLLEWRTAREAQRNTRVHLTGFYRSMWIVVAVSVLAVIAISLLNPPAIEFAAPIIAMWLLAPTVAWAISRPIIPLRPKLTPKDLVFLGTISRRTWRFFEIFIGPADNFLPPDNFQEDPPQGIAHRTSPTNIGLSLLANLAAYDFGYVTVGEVIGRTGRTLTTVERLLRYRGHLFNWYDTRTLEPLRPHYVSSVDSGNLAGLLLTLSSGLIELAGRKIYRTETLAGLRDTFDVLTEIIQGPGDAARKGQTPSVSADIAAKLAQFRKLLVVGIAPNLTATRLSLQRLTTAAAELATFMSTRGSPEAKEWSTVLESQCRFAYDELIFLAPWYELPPVPQELVQRANRDANKTLNELLGFLRRLEEIPTLEETARLESGLLVDIQLLSSSVSSQVEKDWLDRLQGVMSAASERAAHRLTELHKLAARCVELADIDYEFLYDKERHLLSIGYNVDDRRRDVSYYDLLASEARLASFVAIAQGKLPQDHWFSLGRLLTKSGKRAALLSWSGSMFEYLMPLLIMPTYDGTLLDETYRAAVSRQIEYGRERGVPWGVSESGFAEYDTHLNYQYHAFGVPGLGFKRGLADDLVIAPYASVMGLMVDPVASTANLHRLTEDGQFGAYGFYEAVDYTPSRVPRGQTSVTIKSYMVHHQGMAFLSLVYLLRDRPMQRRFEADPAFRATDLLLQERVPNIPSVYPHPSEVSAARSTPTKTEPHHRRFTTPNTTRPEVHLLSNGRYHVAVTASGGGYSRWKDLAVTRWQEDPTRDCWGTFCYLRDTESGEFWSVAHQPTNRRADSYEAIYSQGRAEFRRRDGEIETHVEISVSPEDDIELRRVSITNRGQEPRKIELTTYAEVVLATPAADAAHPAFSNLFVQTHLVRDRQAILCTRRPRSGGERPPWMMHLMTVYGQAIGAASYETGRSEFIGRGRTLADPAAMHRRHLTDSEGSVLDPVVAIRTTLLIAPGETARVHVVTGIAETRESAMGLVEKYHDRHLANRVFELAWTHSQVALRQLDATESDTQLYGRLAGSILYSNLTLRAPGSVIARNQRGQSGLWGYGISGDLPIVLLKIGDHTQINLVRQLIQAHTYWRGKGLTVDLVIWNEDQSGYRQMLQEQIMAVIASAVEASLVDKPGGIFVRRTDQMSEEDKTLMQTVARVVLSDTAGTLGEQVERRPRLETTLPAFNRVEKRRPEIPVAAEIHRSDLAEFNGTGGFTQDGREYVITTTHESPTPAPWVNVLANPWFGTVVSESGGAYTWCENANSYRLTPWNNDPVSDTSGEAFYVRDEESGHYWSPTPLPARGAMPYTTRHGFGYTMFNYSEGGISTELRSYVATDAPVKFNAIKIHNGSGRPRRVSVTAYFELVLGAQRPANAPHVVTEIDPKTGTLLARNPYNTEFAQRIAFLDCSESQRTVTGDRTEFLGRNGRPGRPAAMMRARLSGRVGGGLDPCMAVQVMVDLADGQEREIVFTFGSGRDLTDARNLISRFHSTSSARSALENVWNYWNRTLGAVNVQTPDRTVNYLANGWLLYQVIACRMWGRSGFYQSGGAFGFRDQLQDSMAVVHAEPALLREQLLRSAAHQFREGDVQHWWHPPSGRGVRTRISDDYLWLPYAACRYVQTVGDTGVLGETVRFIDGRAVKIDEESYYDLPGQSEESATLYEHCVRSIKHGLRFGEHGLPLMGCGDWNDGMNLVGEHGRGESVWLAFFLYDVLVQFAKLATRQSDHDFAETCRTEAEKLRANIELHAWDGKWYRRAYFDNGEPMGSESNEECKIDSLPQSWSVLSKAGTSERSASALAALDERLVKRDIGLIQLFDPAFDTSAQNPGYIKGYVPGVRENGGQYTHAAVWAVMAFAANGDAAKAWELFQLINPIRHGDSEASIATYKVEPYVVAADVYSNPQHAGRGGWTWYTGSAGWMYRLITESLLGLRLDVDRLHVNPVMPADWQTFDIHYRHRETVYHIHVSKVPGAAANRVVCDGVEQSIGAIPLMNDHKEHQVQVEVGETKAN